MKIQRKLAGFSACALVLSSLTVPVAHAAEVNFKDIDSHWAKSSIERWAGYEVVNGMGNDQFKPEDTMTRAQMAQILSKTLGLTATATTNPFTDVKDSDWFKDAILKCNAAGIMNGTSATTAKPDAPISRQDAVTMMSRALGIEADGDSTSFDDNGSIGNWAVGFVNAMAKRGIVNGRSEGMFAPKGDIKRGEIATILDRAITTYVNTPNTEVTATGKGITLIAASGVTVKGEAEDILVAPAAAGTTKLDGVKVSGAVTMQAADGTLVLGGKTTAAKLNVPALATGAKITIEKDATVAAMNSAADNVAIDGAGKITEMTVAGGKGVTVAGSVQVGKIINNGSDSVKKGNTTVAANTTWNGTTTSGGGGGGSSSGNNNNNNNNNNDQTSDDTKVPPVEDVDDSKPPVIAKDLKSTEDFVEAAQTQGNKSVTTSMDTDVDSMGSFTIVNNSVTEELNLDLSTATAGTVVIRAEKVANISIKGSNTEAESQIKQLIIEAPKATVETDVTVGEAEVEQVSDSSYHPLKKHKKVNMKGAGTLEVKDKNTVDEVSVSTKEKNSDNTANKVTIKGYVPKLNVNSAADIVLDAIKDILELFSSHKNANITVNTGIDVTVSGQIGKLTSSSNVTMKNAAINQVTMDADLAISKAEDDTKSNIATLDAKGNVAVEGVSVEMLTPAKDATVTVGAGAVVNSITTANSITIGGSGTVNSVDVTANDVKIDKATDATVDVMQVAAIGTTTDTSKVDVTAWEGLTVVKKHPRPDSNTVKGERSDTWGEDGTISGVDNTMEYRQETADSKYADVTGASLTVKAGTYLVRVKETGEGADKVLASEPLRVTVPAQVGVTSASIIGSAITGQTLVAVPNTDADPVGIAYQWMADGKNIEGKTEFSLIVSEDLVGKKIKVTVSNYNGAQTATSSETDAVTADLTNLNKALKEAKAAIANVIIADNASYVPQGMKFATESNVSALQAMIDSAETFLKDGVLNTDNVTEETNKLTEALENFSTADGTATDPAAVSNILTTKIADAEKLKDSAKESTQDGFDVAPANKWYSPATGEAITKAITAAKAADTTSLQAIIDAITELNTAMNIFNKRLMNGAPINTASLDTAITNAMVNVSSVTAIDSVDDKTKLFVGTIYVKTSDAQTYRTKITQAMTATIAPATQNDVIAALEALNAATETFNNAKVPGTTTQEPEVALHAVTTATVANGTLSVDKENAREGVIVGITAAPADNYRLKADSLKATYTVESDTKDIALTKGAADNTWTFTMPAYDVNVTAEFEAIPTTTYTVTWTVTGLATGDAAEDVVTVKNGTTTLTSPATVPAGTTLDIAVVDETKYTLTSDAKVTVDKDTEIAITVEAVAAETGEITVDDTTNFTYTVKDDTTTYTLADDVRITDIVTVSPTTAGANKDVTITLDIAKLKNKEGTYTLDADATTITLTDKPGNSLSNLLTKGTEDNTWTFTMPDPAVNINIKVSNLTLTWDKTTTNT